MLIHLPVGEEKVVLDDAGKILVNLPYFVVAGLPRLARVCASVFTLATMVDAFKNRCTCLFNNCILVTS